MTEKQEELINAFKEYIEALMRLHNLQYPEAPLSWEKIIKHLNYKK